MDDEKQGDMEVSIKDLFDQFIEASTMRNVLATHRRIMSHADLNPCEFNEFFPKLKRAVLANRQRNKNWKAKALFSKIDKRAAQRCYSNTKPPTPTENSTKTNNSQINSTTYSRHEPDDSMSSLSSSMLAKNQSNCNNALQNHNCLIIGSGPAGLRTAIELQLLGANKVVIVEKRERFSRNNVLHLWPFVIDDLKSLGAKKFYGKFCAGSIDHISIRQLQLILLKVCLMIGCDFRESCSYTSLCPATIKHDNVNGVQENTNSDDGTVLENTSGSCDIKYECDIVQDDARVPTASHEQEESTRRLDKEEDAEVSQLQGKENSLRVDQTTVASRHLTKLDEHQDKCKRTDKLRGVKAHFECETKIQEKELHSYEWDIIIGADGRRNTLSKFFPRKEFRGRLAIAITANFINRQTTAETSVPEISGLSFIYNQDMFNALAYDTNIQLENVCYYKDDTHYFVMTAKKKSLLERGVLMNDYATTQDLLSDNNVNRDALLKYAKDAASWTTGLEPLDFALNHYGQEDCAMFDFTSMYAASNACKALRTTRDGLTLVALVGDSLLEPFWPTGSGCARGFLSSFDAAWMCRQWAVNKCAMVDYHHHNSNNLTGSSRAGRNRTSTPGGQTIEPTTYNKMALSVMAERESIYRILAQTTSENLQQNYSHWTLNPHTRYPNLNRHLIMPSQVEHLMTDCEAKYGHDHQVDSAKARTLSPPSAGCQERARRVKSPNARRSPKKLKSANASPVTQPRNFNNRSKSLSKYKSKSRPDLGLRDIDDDDTYLEFEESYRNLVDRERPGGMTQYLGFRRPDCDLYDDLFVPSISGTLPSSNNLQNLEARRARDIDECLRQRRQKTKINVVREELIGRLKAGSEGPGREGSPGALFGAGGNAVLFNELRKLREQQARSGSSRPESGSSPLSLLNSMRRCASFAERVKSFESKLSSDPSQDQSQVTTPKTPIDNVRNLPQFATLQELFVNNSTLPGKEGQDKIKHPSRIPVVTKLTKDDWNVKCWEKRLAANANGKVANDNLNGASRNLNKSLSVDSHRNRFQRPKKQVDVFQDRIKEMAGKLEVAKKNNAKLYGENKFTQQMANGKENGQQRDQQSSQVRSQGWINHLKRELSKGVEAKNQLGRQPMNPVLPNKPIKKLFDDDDDEDDGIDVNKHYDHLCINRPKNKYLSKGGGYKSHLVRTKFDSATSKVINRPNPTGESKQAYLAALASRASSASSTRSDYSTNTANSSSGSGKQTTGSSSSSGQANSVIDVECFRCRKFVSTSDRITVGDCTLHRVCLTCASCGITLRSNEIQHYLDLAKTESGSASFTCAICKPSIRADLSREAASRLAAQKGRESTTGDDDNDEEDDDQYQTAQQKKRMQSREDFLNARIDYSELYKNIMTNNGNNMGATSKAAAISKSGATPNTTGEAKFVSPSPVDVTLPLASSTDIPGGSQPGSRASNQSDLNRSPRYRIARSETIDDGSEQVTLVLAPGETSTPVTETPNGLNSASRNLKQREMIDEEELERILHLDNRNTSSVRRASSSSTSSVESSISGSTSDGSSRVGDDGGARKEQAESVDTNGKQSDDSSSLNSPPVSDDYDNEDDDSDNGDQNSTYDDLVTSEEFEESTTSDKEEPGEQEDELEKNGPSSAASVAATAISKASQEPQQQQQQRQPRTSQLAS